MIKKSLKFHAISIFDLANISNCKPEIKYGTIISHDQINTDSAYLTSVYREFKSSGVDMETASAALVSKYNNTPFNSIKSIFDLDGAFSLEDYNQNISLYHENSVRVLATILENLCP